MECPLPGLNEHFLSSVLSLVGSNTSFCLLLLLQLSTMETSPQRATDKKDKMDGSGFTDLPKKPSPSETRGKALLKTFSLNQGLNLSLEPGIRPRHAVNRGLPSVQPGGKEGSKPSDEIYISKTRRQLGS